MEHLKLHLLSLLSACVNLALLDILTDNWWLCNILAFARVATHDAFFFIVFIYVLYIYECLMSFCCDLKGS